MLIASALNDGNLTTDGAHARYPTPEHLYDYPHILLQRFRTADNVYDLASGIQRRIAWILHYSYAK